MVTQGSKAQNGGCSQVILCSMHSSIFWQTLAPALKIFGQIGTRLASTWVVHPDLMVSWGVHRSACGHVGLDRCGQLQNEHDPGRARQRPCLGWHPGVARRHNAANQCLRQLCRSSCGLGWVSKCLMDPDLLNACGQHLCPDIQAGSLVQVRFPAIKIAFLPGRLE